CLPRPLSFSNRAFPTGPPRSVFACRFGRYPSSPCCATAGIKAPAPPPLRKGLCFRDAHATTKRTELVLVRNRRMLKVVHTRGFCDHPCGPASPVRTYPPNLNRYRHDGEGEAKMDAVLAALCRLTAAAPIGRSAICSLAYSLGQMEPSEKAHGKREQASKRLPPYLGPRRMLGPPSGARRPVRSHRASLPGPGFSQSRGLSL